jgi:hypothetical protein
MNDRIYEHLTVSPESSALILRRTGQDLTVTKLLVYSNCLKRHGGKIDNGAYPEYAFSG